MARWNVDRATGLGDSHLGEQASTPTLPAGVKPKLGTFLQTLHKTIRSLERRYEEQRKLREATTRANVGLMLDDILEQAYQAFRPLIPYQRIGLAILEEEGQTLRTRWVRTESGEPRLKPGHVIPKLGHGLQTILDTGKPRILQDLPTYLARNPDAVATRLMVEEGFRSTLACPLIAVGRPMGFLFFSSTQPAVYDEGHVELLTQLASEVAMIVEKGRMYEELQRSHERLEAEVLALAKTERVLRQTQADLESANRVLSALAATDGLTGVANRRSFDEYFDREWRRALRNNLSISLVLIDLDFFKLFNDTHGHLAGDDCLRSLATALRKTVKRPSDLVARYGGEEFAVLLPETGLEPAAMLAQRMREAIEALAIPHRSSPIAGVITASLGVASRTPRAGESLASLIQSADQALYLAKRQGRNRFAVSVD